MTAPNTQIVGQSLTLQCEVTTVRGIISSLVDIVWSSNGTELERIYGVSLTTMNNSQVYTDSYTISHLNTTDDGRVIQCEIVINALRSPSVMATDSITLDVIGKHECCMYTFVTRLAKIPHIHTQWQSAVFITNQWLLLLSKNSLDTTAKSKQV